MAHVVRRVVHNPADPTQGYKLWSSGLIQSIGTAPAMSLPQDILDRFEQQSAQDIVVVDWLTPSAYVLSWTGAIFVIGGATPVANNLETGGFHIWRKLVMNPAGNGQGYKMDNRGRIYKFGAVLPPNLSHHSSITPNADGLCGGIDWAADHARDFALDWSTKRYAILRMTGEVYSPSYLINPDPTDPIPLTFRDLFRSIAFVNPAMPVGDTAFYVMTYTGRLFGSNGAEHVKPFAIWPDRDVAVDVNMISDGRAGRPLIVEVVHEGGSRRNVTVSSPPFFEWIEPANPVTTTSRPPGTWSFSDIEGDAQASATVRLFTAAQVAAPGFSVSTTTPLIEWEVTDRATFQVVPDHDLPNGSYRYYGRATDTSGEVSAWDDYAFTLTVVPPPTPTAVAVADPSDWSTTITVTAGVSTPNGLSALVEYTDDPAAANTIDAGWSQVVGGIVAYPTSGAKVVTVTDWQAPFNVARRYRARTIQVSPRLTSAPSTISTATIVTDEWVLSNAATGEATELLVEPTFAYTRDSGGAASKALGRDKAIVRSQGIGPAEFDLTLRTENREDFDALETLIRARSTLHMRDPYRRSFFVKLVGSIPVTMAEVAPDIDETTEFRFQHTHVLSVAEVDRPTP